MVVRLSRNKLAQVCRAFDGGEFDARNVYATAAPVVFFVKNAGNASLNEGAPLAVSGFSSALSFAKASERLNNGALVLTADVPASGGDVHAIALERIAPGKIGRATSSGLVFHAVTINASSDGYASAAFSSSSTASFYKILAKSSTSSGSAIAALFHATSGGGGTSQTVTFASNFTTSNGNLVITLTTLDVLVP